MTLLSNETIKEIDQWLTKFPADQKQSAVLTALRLAQEQNGGHLTEELMNAVGDYLDMPHVAVYEVATFYSMYNHSPVGKYQINVCDSISCMLNNSEGVVNHLKEKLGIDLGQTTKDGKFTLNKVGCLGACVGAPVVQVNKDYKEKVTPESLDKLVEELE